MTAAEIENPEIITLLVKRGAYVDQVLADDKKYETALHSALHHQKVKAVKSLIENGANINLREEGNLSFLMISAINRKPECFNILLDAGADLQGNIYSGESVLSYAARSGDLRRIKDLIQRGVTIDKTGLSGTMALRGAIYGKNPEIVALFIKQGVEYDPLQKIDYRTVSDMAKESGVPAIIELIKDNQNKKFVNPERTE